MTADIDLAEAITALVAQKRAVGYKYRSEERVLARFEELCRRELTGLNTVTQAAVEAWIGAARRRGAKPATLQTLASPVRERNRPTSSGHKPTLRPASPDPQTYKSVAHPGKGSDRTCTVGCREFRLSPTRRPPHNASDFLFYQRTRRPMKVGTIRLHDHPGAAPEVKDSTAIGAPNTMSLATSVPIFVQVMEATSSSSQTNRYSLTHVPKICAKRVGIPVDRFWWIARQKRPAVTPQILRLDSQAGGMYVPSDMRDPSTARSISKRSQQDRQPIVVYWPSVGVETNQELGPYRPRRDFQCPSMPIIGGQPDYLGGAALLK